MSDTATREVVAIFHDEHAMERAFSALQAAGVAPEEIQLMASCSAVEAKLGHRFATVRELEDAPATPRLAYIPAGEEKQYQNTLIGSLTFVAASAGLILASSTGLAQMLVAATAAGGAIASVGEAMKWLVGHNHAHRFEEQLNCGGLLVWVRVGSDARAATVSAILEQHGGSEVHLRSAAEDGSTHPA